MLYNTCHKNGRYGSKCQRDHNIDVLWLNSSKIWSELEIKKNTNWEAFFEIDQEMVSSFLFLTFRIMWQFDSFLCVWDLCVAVDSISSRLCKVSSFFNRRHVNYYNKRKILSRLKSSLFKFNWFSIWYHCIWTIWGTITCNS